MTASVQPHHTFVECRFRGEPVLQGFPALSAGKLPDTQVAVFTTPPGIEIRATGSGRSRRRGAGAAVRRELRKTCRASPFCSSPDTDVRRQCESRGPAIQSRILNIRAGSSSILSGPPVQDPHAGPIPACRRTCGALHNMPPQQLLFIPCARGRTARAPRPSGSTR